MSSGFYTINESVVPSFMELGKAYSTDEIKRFLNAHEALAVVKFPYTKPETHDQLLAIYVPGNPIDMGGPAIKKQEFPDIKNVKHALLIRFTGFTHPINGSPALVSLTPTDDGKKYICRGSLLNNTSVPY